MYRAGLKPNPQTVTINNGQTTTASGMYTSGSATGVPILISPVNGSVLNDNDLSHTSAIGWYFNWQDVSDATKYQIYVIGSGAQNPVIDTETTNSYFTLCISGSAQHVLWNWKVRAYINGTWSEWSETRSFNVDRIDVTCDANTDSDCDGIPNSIECGQYAVSVSANPAAGGTVTGGGTFNGGASVTVIATPNTGYVFVNWTENGSPKY